MMGGSGNLLGGWVWAASQGSGTAGVGDGVPVRSWLGKVRYLC